MVLYGVTLVPLVEELWEADPGILTPLYVDDATFEGLSRRSAQMLKLLMKRVRTRGNSLIWTSCFLYCNHLNKSRGLNRGFRWRNYI